jgi:DNA-binding MarR family transcriptional regulator
MVGMTEIKKSLRAPKELASKPSFLLKRLGMIAKEKTVDAFENAGAVPYDYAVLAVLAQGACATQAHIADALNYDRSYLVGLLDELERRGLIDRRRDLNDRRRHVVTLTKAGEQELVRLRALIDGIESDLFAPLSAAERKTLQGLLAKLAAAHDPRYATD